MSEPRYDILHCLRAPVGGLFRHVRDLAREQAARGHRVGLFCDLAASDALTEPRLAALAPELALGLVRLPMSREIGPADVNATRALVRLVRDKGFHVLHGHGAKGGAYARLAAGLLRRAGGRAPVAIYTPHGGSLHYHPASLKGRFYMAAERHMARLTDGIVFESAYAEAQFRANVGAPACVTRVVHNGVSRAELEPVTPVPDAADFVFVGELRRLKGVDVMIEALSLLAEEGVCPRLEVVGAGSDGPAFQALALARGLGDRVRFRGALPARDAFRLGRCLVLPSRAESLPYVVLEAAAAGLPLIATDVGGIPEIVAGTSTRLVPPGDAAALATAMRETLAAPQAAVLEAVALHRRIAAGFSVETMADGVLGLYAELIEHAETAGSRLAA